MAATCDATILVGRADVTSHSTLRARAWIDCRMWVRFLPALSLMQRKAGVVTADMARWRKPNRARRASWPNLQ